MHARLKYQLIAVSVLAASACLIFLLVGKRPETRRPAGEASNPGIRSDAGLAPVAATAEPRIRSFEQRLQESPAADWKNPASQAQRAAIFIEWLNADRGAAMRYLAHAGYKDLWLPGVARAIGERATAAELLDIANGADHPGETVYQVGRWANAGAINDLANLMPSVDAGAAGKTAGAIGSLLAGINMDRAMAFAMGQPTDLLRGYAVSGVMNELADKPDGDAQARSWYASLPSSVQNSDPVLAAYGNSIWASDPAAALQALQGIADPQTKMIACLVLARNSTSSSPETAIAAIYESGLTGVGIYNHVSPILQNWYAVNPQAASNFLSTTQIIPPADVSKYAPIFVPPGGGKG
jgi:hypothetical protein